MDAEPGNAAREYVSRASKQQLEASLRSQAGLLARNLTTDYAEAIMMEVAEGKLSLQDAILKIEEHKDVRFDKALDNADKLMEKGLLTEVQARNFVLPNAEVTRPGLQDGTADRSAPQENDGFGQFYGEG